MPRKPEADRIYIRTGDEWFLTTKAVLTWRPGWCQFEIRSKDLIDYGLAHNIGGKLNWTYGRDLPKDAKIAVGRWSHYL